MSSNIIGGFTIYDYASLITGKSEKNKIPLHHDEIMIRNKTKIISLHALAKILVIKSEKFQKSEIPKENLKFR